MTAKLCPIVITLIAELFILGTGATWAAKAPVSPEGLKKEASQIVDGTVVEVTSKVHKSKVETAAGIHRDRVFRIILKVKTVSQGTKVMAGDEIEVFAWQPARRIPPLPGLQGHDPIPKTGDTVTIYLKVKKGGAFEPILPNGIVIDKKAD